MIKVSRVSLVLPFIFLFPLLKSQETIIKVPFSQPGKLLLDAGDNQVLETGQTLTLGSDVSISGGSLEYQYTWNDNLGNDYFTPTISVTGAGKYYLTVTDENHCTAIDSVIVAQFSSMNISELVSDFSVFPNPSAGVFYYRIIKPENKDVLEVISAEGRVVFKQEFGSAQGDHTGSIDLTGLGIGLYNVILFRKGNNQIKTIIIQ
jgi:hypothetical protein